MKVKLGKMANKKNGKETDMSNTKSVSVKEKAAGLKMEWVLVPGAVLKADDKWNLMYGVNSKTGKRRVVATVWGNGVWHTFDRHGSGGENWAESSVDKAKDEAKASAISQGFV